MAEPMLSSDKVSELNSTDMHTVSISCSSIIDKELLQGSIQTAYKMYSTSHKLSKLTTSAVTLGGIHPKQRSVHVCVRTRCGVRTFHNLLVGKTEEGEDLFEIVYEDTAGTIWDETSQAKPTKPFPETLDQLDISLKDMAQETAKMTQVLDMVRSLDSRVRYDLKQRIRWLPPIFGSLCCKIIPAKFNKEYSSSIQHRVLTVSLLKNNISQQIIEKLLDKVTARSHREIFYLKHQDIKGKSPLTLMKKNQCEIHFKCDKQTKLAYNLLFDKNEVNCLRI